MQQLSIVCPTIRIPLTGKGGAIGGEMSVLFRQFMPQHGGLSNDTCPAGEIVIDSSRFSTLPNPLSSLTPSRKGHAIDSYISGHFLTLLSVYYLLTCCTCMHQGGCASYWPAIDESD
jgi:hypothetical protein